MYIKESMRWLTECLNKVKCVIIYLCVMGLNLKAIIYINRRFMHTELVKMFRID